MSELLEAHRLLSYKDLIALGVNYSRLSLVRLEAKGRFPKHIKLGFGPSARVAWVEAEVLAWIEARMAARVEQADDAA